MQHKAHVSRYVIRLPSRLSGGGEGRTTVSSETAGPARRARVGFRHVLGWRSGRVGMSKACRRSNHIPVGDVSRSGPSSSSFRGWNLAPWPLAMTETPFSWRSLGVIQSPTDSCVKNRYIMNYKPSLCRDTALVIMCHAPAPPRPHLFAGIKFSGDVWAGDI